MNNRRVWTNNSRPHGTRVHQCAYDLQNSYPLESFSISRRSSDLSIAPSSTDVTYSRVRRLPIDTAVSNNVFHVTANTTQ